MNQWPDSQVFWRNKRVIVTGGSGFLGSFIVDKLQQRGAAEVIIPRRIDYDLRDIDAIRQLLLDVVGHPPHPGEQEPVYVIHLAAPSAASAPTAPNRPSSSTTT